MEPTGALHAAQPSRIKSFWQTKHKSRFGKKPWVGMLVGSYVWFLWRGFDGCE